MATESTTLPRPYSVGKLTKKIADMLHETERTGIESIRISIKRVGSKQAIALAEEAIAIDENGGMLVADGSRPRTLGGIYFHLIRQHIAEQPPLPSYTWEQRLEDAQQFTDADRGEGEMVITMTGQPQKVIDRGAAVLLVMVTKTPHNLPKLLPTPPDTVPSTHLAIVMKPQWEEVEAAVSKGANIRITGYPLYDDEMKRITTLVKSIQTVHRRRTKTTKTTPAN